MPITMTVPPLAYRKLILQDDPIIYYKLDEKSGSTFFDTTGNYDTATSSGTFTLNQSPLITTGKSVLWTSGAARSTATSALEPTNDFSLELWVRFTGTPFAAVVTLRETSPGDIWLVMTRSRSVSGSIGAETWNFTNVSTRVESSAINDDSPHYVVATYRNSDDTLRLYIDGSFVDSAVQGGVKPTSSSPRLSLANNDGALQPFNGYMDEVALYHFELTPEQIQKHYERGIGI